MWVLYTSLPQISSNPHIKPFLTYFQSIPELLQKPERFWTPHRVYFILFHFVLEKSLNVFEIRV